MPVALPDQARLRCDDPTKNQTDSKELVPLNLGSHVLYDKTLITLIKDQNGPRV